MTNLKLLSILTVCVVVAWCTAAIATPTDVYNFQKFGGTWNDVNKTSANQDDDLMCWAATNANTLAWLGWTPNSSLDTAPEIWNYYLDHWADYGGWAYWGWQWWFDGTNPGNVEYPGGDFYTPPYTWSDFYHAETSQNYTNVMNAVADYIDKGYGISLWVYGPSSHAITAWGYKIDGSSKLGVWITDSDDQEGVQQLLYFNVRDEGGVAYLDDYRGGSYQLRAVYGLDQPAINFNVSSGSFTTASNWAPNYVPDSLLEARIDGNRTALVTANATAKAVYAGFFGAGTVSQSGGTLTAGDVVLGEFANGNGTYTTSGGTLAALNLTVGKGGAGALSVTNNAGLIRITNGGKFTFSSNATYSAVTGAKIYMENNTVFDNRAISTLNLDGLNNTTFVYNGTGPASYSLFEIAGKNFGAVQSGFTNNYALKGLYIGYDGGAPISAAQLRLINLFYNFDPQGPQSPEALYVNTLILGQGSTLDLNNLTVYALAYTNYGGTVLNGSINIVSGGQNGELVPEPLSAVMLAFSACASFAVLRRRRA